MPASSSVGWLGCSRVAGPARAVHPGHAPRGQPPALTQRAAELRDDLAAPRDQQQVLHAAQLADGGGHLGRQAGGDLRGRHRVGQQRIAQPADGQVGDGREGGGVVRVDDEAGHFIVLVGHDGFVQEGLERQVGQCQLRGDPLARIGRGDAGQLVAGAPRAGPGEQRAQVGEPEALAAKGVGMGHGREFAPPRGGRPTRPPQYRNFAGFPSCLRGAGC